MNWISSVVRVGLARSLSRCRPQPGEALFTTGSIFRDESTLFFSVSLHGNRQHKSIERGAEFHDAFAGGFDGHGKRKGGGFIEEQYDAIEFTSSGPAG